MAVDVVAPNTPANCVRVTWAKFAGKINQCRDKCNTEINDTSV